MKNTIVKNNLLMAAAMLLMAHLSLYAAEDVNPVEGPYKADWGSLSEWQCPEWFKDAKFGIWAHWGPQCEAEDGDWYARFMYYRGSSQYNYHVRTYGNPSTFGFKDLCNEWKAENWNPKELIELYKSVGARYFMMLGNHHDNFDLWNSPYQEWNSVNIGPRRDLVGEWTKEAREAGLHTGVSIHASHAWTWMEGSQEFDGNLTKEDGYTPNADGSEKWWKGYDPQELYAQSHEHSVGWTNSGTIHSQWDWGNGASLPDKAYKQKLMNRTLQLINDYDPDMIYFDDTVLPFYGCDNEWGQQFLASYYNYSAAKNDGTPDVVVTGKQLPEGINHTMLWDVERGAPDRMQAEYWQTCTCIGDWHYSKDIYRNNSYKNGATVVRMLVDVISKNGNLLLNIPIKGDGTIDEKERKVLDDIKKWMDVNAESIYGTRTWKTFGEGPLAEGSNPMSAQGFNEAVNYTSHDVRFVQKDGIIYATIMAWPGEQNYTIESFSPLSDYYSGNVTSVILLGHGSIPFTLTHDGLTVELPVTPTNDIAPVLAITTDGATISASERLALIIERVKTFLAEALPSASYINSGFYNKVKLQQLQNALDQAENSTEDESAIFAELNSTFRSVRDSGMNVGGLYPDITDCEEDLTEEKLIEKQGFTRAEKVYTRFARPLNWTVENFKIPNGSDGIKEGLDKFTGREALMLGVWNDRENNQTGSVADARIYRRITLPAGRYFFGGAYNTTYNITHDAYIFVANDVMPTAQIPTGSIAFFRVSAGKEDLANYYGLWFTLDKEQEVVLGWQADLLHGSSTQEFRVEKVALLRLPEITADQCTELIAKVDEFTSFLANNNHLNYNTGYYPPEAYKAVTAALEMARKDMSENIEKAYFELSDAWETFLNSRNPLVETPAHLTSDITELALVEKSAFTPSEPGVDTRFATPAYWSVDNFRMPRGDEGVKGGLDKYEGEYALMLGVWDDRGKNTLGDYSNARIYRKVELAAGEYFFGAAYNALYNMHTAYVFVASSLCDTEVIPQQATAYAAISDNKNDHKTRGLMFTIDTPGEYYLGWQADLSKGEPYQEFRAESVLLLTNGASTGIDAPAIDSSHDAPAEYFNLQGIRIAAPVKGLNIVRRGSRTTKIIIP